MTYCRGWAVKSSGWTLTKQKQRLLVLHIFSVWCLPVIGQTSGVAISPSKHLWNTSESKLPRLSPWSYKIWSAVSVATLFFSAELRRLASVWLYTLFQKAFRRFYHFLPWVLQNFCLPAEQTGWLKKVQNRERERERQTDRGRQRNRERRRQIQTERDRQTEKQTDRDRDTETDRGVQHCLFWRNVNTTPLLNEQSHNTIVKWTRTQHHCWMNSHTTPPLNELSHNITVKWTRTQHHC